MSFFDESEKESDQDLMEDITYSKSRKRHKDERKLKLQNIKHIKEVYIIDEKDRVCFRCGNQMNRLMEEFV